MLLTNLDLVPVMIFMNFVDKIDRDDIKNTLQMVFERFGSNKTWEKREALSFWFNERVRINTTWYRAQGTIEFPVDQFVADPVTVFSKLITQLDLPVVESRMANLESIFRQWSELQRHSRADARIGHLVDCVVNNVAYDWQHLNLTIFEEACVQSLLRDLHQLELACYNLDVFPTNTKELREYLIDVKPI